MTHASKYGLTCVIDQPPGSGAPLWADPIQFAASAHGGASGFSIVTTDLGGVSDSDDDFVGMLVECIAAEHAANLGVIRRIVESAEAIGVVTLLVERFPLQTRDLDVYRLIDLTEAYPMVADDAAAPSAIQIEDSTRDEVDDHWLGSAEEGGPYVETIEADTVLKTTAKLVTDSTALGVISAALLANTAVGDLYDLICCQEWQQHPFIECTREPLIREQYMGTYDLPANALGRRVAQGSGELLFRGPGSTRDGERAECSRILASVLDEDTNADLTVDIGSTTELVAYDAGVAVDGGLYCTAEGDCFMCSSAATPLVPLPDLRTAPIEDTIVIGLQRYVTSDDVNAHLAAKQYRGDGVMEMIFGMVPTLTFTAELNGFLRIGVSLQGSDWYRIHKDTAGSLARAWRARRPTVAPVKVQGGRIVMGDSVYRLKSATIDLGLEFALAEDANAPNQSTGYRIVGCSPKGQFTGIVDASSLALLEEHDSGREIPNMLIQIGSRTGYPGVFCFWGHKAQVTNINLQDDGGKLGISMDWKICDHDTGTSGLPTWALGLG